ncbi:Telo2 interacting protein 1 [Carabus blaptoides fortunei]
MCIQIAKNELMRELRLKAIECLMTMSYVHDKADFTDVVFRKQVSDCTMFFLPGITSCMRKVALDDEKQGHRITSLAIKALYRVITLHMTDYEPNEPQQVSFQFPAPKVEKQYEPETFTRDGKGMLKQVETQKQSPEWYKNIADNLKEIIESIMPLQYQSHPKVRFEISELCRQILVHCPRHMECCLTYCLEMLISLSEDDNEEISAHSRNTLDQVSCHTLNLTLVDILAENFYGVITRLPRIINGTDIHNQLSILNLLVGYLRILGPKTLFQILQTADNLKRLMQSLIVVSQLEISGITLFEEHAIRNFEAISETSTTWKQFKYINEKVLLSKFQTALQLLSKSEASEIIIDCLCDLFQNEYDQRNEIVFLLNEILSVQVEDMPNRLRHITNVLKMYMDEENWYLPMEVNEQEAILHEVHSNIVQMCLLVEGIGNMSNALGIEFKSFLLKTLYIVLERAGSAQPMLSTAGLTALLKISKSCEYNSVTDLIVQNTDYFSFHVIKRLKRLEQNVRVLDVLNVVMKYSTIDVLPPIMNIINEVLFYSCDKFQEHNTTSFLRVFYSFIQCLRRWECKVSTKKTNKTVQLLKEYKRKMDVYYAAHGLRDEMGQSAEELYEEDINKVEEVNVDNKTEEDYKKTEPPEIIKLTVSVLKRSLNFLPSKNRERKLLVLNILIDGLELISDFENELLPLVHLIWSPLTDRFKENEDSLEISKSFELLIVLAKLSKDFIRHRTSKNIFSNICGHLKNLAEKSYLKDRGSAYRYTQDYKFQLNLLSNLAQLITNLDMTEQDVEKAMDAASPYLSDRQPLPLQQCTVQFYKALACFEFECVWLHLINIWGSKSDQDDVRKRVFRKNTECLLKTLEVLR